MEKHVIADWSLVCLALLVKLQVVVKVVSISRYLITKRRGELMKSV